MGSLKWNFQVYISSWNLNSFLKLVFEVEDWNWSLVYNFEVEVKIWDKSLALKFSVEGVEVLKLTEVFNIVDYVIVTESNRLSYR